MLCERVGFVYVISLNQIKVPCGLSGYTVKKKKWKEVGVKNSRWRHHFQK
jgi:hypothetical protein